MMALQPGYTIRQCSTRAVNLIVARFSLMIAIVVIWALFPVDDDNKPIAQRVHASRHHYNVDDDDDDDMLTEDEMTGLHIDKGSKQMNILPGSPAVMETSINAILDFENAVSIQILIEVLPLRPLSESELAIQRNFEAAAQSSQLHNIRRQLRFMRVGSGQKYDFHYPQELGFEIRKLFSDLVGEEEGERFHPVHGNVLYVLFSGTFVVFYLHVL